jgi:hypothetical protein
MITAQCHCGNVSLKASALPASVTNCNCSICRRLGALWAYYLPNEVTLVFAKQATQIYIWGDEYLEFHHCPDCACSTHYTVTEKYMEEFKKGRIAVNFRLVDTEIVASIPAREFDGAKL